MTDPWHSLYIPDSTATRTGLALTSALTALGYAAFDPFGLIPTRPAPDSVRAFVAPSAGGWVRVIAAIPTGQDVIHALSVEHLLLSLRLEGEQAVVEVWAGGARADLAQLLPYAPAGTTPDALNRTLSEPHAMTNSQPDSFPADVRAMAGASLRGLNTDVVDDKQANRLFDRMMGGLRGKLNADDANAAHALLNSGPQWDSAGGRQLSALAALLLPDTWRTPDYPTVRDAYALHRRLREMPGAKLYPGDGEAQAAVPNAGDYLPIFYARGVAP